MFDLYSPVLLVAMAGLAVLAVSVFTRHTVSDRLPDWLSLTGAMLAIVAALVAVVSHVILGHPPESAESLSVFQFVVVHPAPFVIVALAALGIAFRSRG